MNSNIMKIKNNHKIRSFKGNFYVIETFVSFYFQTFLHYYNLDLRSYGQLLALFFFWNNDSLHIFFIYTSYMTINFILAFTILDFSLLQQQLQLSPFSPLGAITIGLPLLFANAFKSEKEQQQHYIIINNLQYGWFIEYENNFIALYNSCFAISP